jgi:pSer/pThr/pTyr-binding forkhead associated (FHA) protein
MDIFLEILKGMTVGRRFELGQGETLIGRWDPDSGSFPEVNLEGEDSDAKVSRKHAVVLRTGDRVALRDLGSLNGTIVNNKLVPKQGEIVLAIGDQISIGNVTVQLMGK